MRVLQTKTVLLLTAITPHQAGPFPSLSRDRWGEQVCRNALATSTGPQTRSCHPHQGPKLGAIHAGPAQGWRKHQGGTGSALSFETWAAPTLFPHLQSGSCDQQQSSLVPAGYLGVIWVEQIGITNGTQHHSAAGEVWGCHLLPWDGSINCHVNQSSLFCTKPRSSLRSSGC